MKRFFTLLLLTATFIVSSFAQGWPANYGGVMLQGFYWDSYEYSSWVNLKKQAAELGQYFDLVWIPQSGNCGGQSMGYDDLYWFENYNSSFGNKSELLSLISTFKDNGIGTIGDIVINHRRNVSSWFDFPRETYKGETYQLLSTDICRNDDGGAALKEANKQGVSISANNDTGEDWGGMRDLDHKSANVQRSVKAYLKMLIDDFGYTGFRYDMVKGYSPEYTGIYNTYAKPQFSVGECWDGTNTIRNWIDGTKVDGVPTSAAFDFQFRYVVRNACNGTSNSRWSKLNEQNDGNWPLVSNKELDKGDYRRWAVTFVENHDTEYRSSNSPQDPLKKDTLAANAWLLAMPGTPCVWSRHWIDYKQEIKSMIIARKFAGITNTSNFNTEYASGNGYQVGMSNGTNSNLLVVVGENATSYSPTNQWVEILNGYHYRYFLQSKMNSVWIDHASGTYDGSSLKVKVIAVARSSSAKIVYTLNGTTPTASSTQVNSGSEITIPLGTTTLKVGLLVNGEVTNVQTREYNVTGFQPYDITVYVYAGSVEWEHVNFWTWGGDGTHGPKSGGWPGDKVTETVEIEGAPWFAHNYTINSSSDYVNFVFSTGTGSPQTVDINGVSETSYFAISTEKDGDKHLVNVADPTGIKLLDSGQLTMDNSAYYDLQGRRLEGVPTQRGIYIRSGRKIVIK